MTGGDSKILAEKAVPGWSADETVIWSEKESREAEELAFELNAYAEKNITYSVDEHDIKDAVNYALYAKDLDSLRVYKSAILDGVDIFEVDKYIRMLRKCGYSNAASFFTRGTVGLARSIHSALINTHHDSGDDTFDTDNAVRVCSYTMAHPASYGKILRLIAEEKVTSYGRIVAMVDGSIAPSLVLGVL
jgi:hypothetical protein